jgi:hypothetical protein
MAIEMKSISNYDYLRYTTTASREISDEPICRYYMSALDTASIQIPMPWLRLHGTAILCKQLLCLIISEFQLRQQSHKGLKNLCLR